MRSSTKAPDLKKLSKNLGKEIRQNLERYEQLRIYGGSDPFWSDGVNMNLCRNHVIYLKKRIETELPPEYYPEEYTAAIPEEMPGYYMARSDQIREEARKTVEILKGNSDFQYLQKMNSEDLDKEAFQCMNPVRWIFGAEDAIRRDDLVVMRRNRDPDYYVGYLRKCREKLDEILGMEISEPAVFPEGQLSIWDFLGGNSNGN